MRGGTLFSLSTSRVSFFAEGKNERPSINIIKKLKKATPRTQNINIFTAHYHLKLTSQKI